MRNQDDFQFNRRVGAMIKQARTDQGMDQAGSGDPLRNEPERHL